jgi:hypothetical protein
MRKCVNLRRKPWSVPRLRGRGEQGYWYGIAPRLTALLGVCEETNFASRALTQWGLCITMPPVHHGLASEARSTGCQPNEPGPAAATRPRPVCGRKTLGAGILPPALKLVSGPAAAGLVAVTLPSDASVGMSSSDWQSPRHLLPARNVPYPEDVILLSAGHGDKPGLRPPEKFHRSCPRQ